MQPNRVEPHRVLGLVTWVPFPEFRTDASCIIVETNLNKILHGLVTAIISKLPDWYHPGVNYYVGIYPGLVVTLKMESGEVEIDHPFTDRHSLSIMRTLIQRLEAKLLLR